MRSLFTAGVARPEGFEPPAFRIGICCDIQLRYGRIYSAFCIIAQRRFTFNTQGLNWRRPLSQNSYISLLQ